MDADYVLGLTADKLYDEFIETVLSDDRNADELLTELEQSSRYKDDFIFRIHVQTARQYILLIVRDMDVVLEKGIYLVEKCYEISLSFLALFFYASRAKACLALFCSFVKLMFSCFINGHNI